MNDLRIEYDNPQAVYFPGQTVTGKVVIQTSERIKARFLKVCIHGSAETHWSVHERRSRMDGKGRRDSFNETIHYSARIQYLHGETMAWTSNDGSSKLPSGNLLFPFAFGLPANCPPSFEGCHGCIRYSVHVELDRPWKFNKKSKSCFSVIPAFDLNRIPQAIHPMINSGSKTTGLLFKKGCVSMTASLPKRGFVAGEIIPITINIDNGSKKPVTLAKAKMNQMTKFHAKRGASQDACVHYDVARHAKNEVRHDCKLVAECSQNINVPPSTKAQTVLSMKIPAIVPSFNTCPIISVDYNLTVKIDSSSSLFGQSVKCEFPLIIGTIPIRQHVLPAGVVPSAPPAEMPLPMTSASAPPYPVVGEKMTTGAMSPPPPYPQSYSTTATPSAPPSPPSYEESMYGISGTTTNAEDAEPFAPRYPVYNNLQQSAAPPLPPKY